LDVKYCENLRRPEQVRIDPCDSKKSYDCAILGVRIEDFQEIHHTKQHVTKREAENKLACEIVGASSKIGVDHVESASDGEGSTDHVDVKHNLLLFCLLHFREDVILFNRLNNLLFCFFYGVLQHNCLYLLGAAKQSRSKCSATSVLRSFLLWRSM